MIISIDAGKAFNKIQHCFMVRTFDRLGVQGSFLSLIKAIYEKPTANIIPNDKKWKIFPLRSGTRHRCNFFTMYY